jgi:hypothetical protein
MLLAIAAVAASADGSVRLPRPAGATVERTLPGRPLMAEGWRLMWDGRPAGAGEPLIRVTLRSRSDPGVVDEIVQVGRSRAPSAVRTCLNAGLGGGTKLPARRFAGHRWAAVRHADAGMSQEVTATDYRAVIGGSCWAVARVRYAVRAREPAPGLPAAATASAAMDRALAGLQIGRKGSSVSY